MEFDAAVSTIFQDRESKFVSVMSDFARQYAPQMRTENVKLAVKHLDAELENFLAVLDLIHHMPGESRPLGQLLLALEHYFDTRGLWKLVLDYSLTIVDYHTREGGSFPGELYNTIGNAYNALGDYEQAIHYYTMILPNLEANPDFEKLLTVHYSNIGLTYRKMGDLEEAEKYLEKSVALEEKRGNLVGWALSLMNLSEVAYARWDMERALQISLDAMKIIEQTDNLHLQAQFSANIAVHMVANFQFDEAAPIYEQAIDKLTQIGDEIYLAEVRFNYALLCRILKKYTLGRELAVQSLQVFEQVGMKTEAEKARDLLQKYEAYD